MPMILFDEEKIGSEENRPSKTVGRVKSLYLHIVHSPKNQLNFHNIFLKRRDINTLNGIRIAM